MKNLSTNPCSKITMNQTLPKKIQTHETEIRRIVNVIVDTVKDKIAFVILYDLFAYDNLALVDQNGYNFLIITKDRRYGAKNIVRRFEKRIVDQINSKIKDKKLAVNLSIEPLDYFNCKLNEKKYFFAKIKDIGILLYDSKEFDLLKVELDFEYRIELAKHNYKNWIAKSKRFIRYFEVGIDENDLGGAAFNLHQGVEALLNCYCLVVNGYEVRTHDLRKLIKICAISCKQFLMVFLSSTPKQKKSFYLLRKSYLDSRYGTNYQITKDDLRYLAERVKILMELVIDRCGKEIAEMIDKPNFIEI